jgi:hypothetical protein
MNEDSSPASLEPFIKILDAASRQAPLADRAEFVRLVVMLFTAVRACHQAYLRYKEQYTGETYESWAASIVTLRSAIESLAATLHVFAPNVFTSVAEYGDSEEFGPYRPKTIGSEFLMSLPDRVYHSDYIARMGGTVGFDVVIDQLGKFIRENFSMEEVFRASST